MGKSGKTFKTVDKRRGMRIEKTALGDRFVSGNLIGGCLTKQAFPHESVARKVANHMTKTRKHQRTFRTYLCCFCGKYHVTGMNADDRSDK